MLVDKGDSLLVTSMGFGSKIVFLNDTMENMKEPLQILMLPDTILINEFVVYAYWDYETFKQIIVEMKPRDFDFDRLDFSENLMLSLPVGTTGLSPIQALYNRYNRSARLNRKLVKNREKYNQLMIDMGRPQDTIPPIPEHMQASPR